MFKFLVTQVHEYCTGHSLAWILLLKWSHVIGSENSHKRRHRSEKSQEEKKTQGKKIPQEKSISAT